MNRITYETAKKKLVIEAPGSWQELNSEQFQKACLLHLCTKSEGIEAAKQFKELLGINNRIYKKIPKSYIMAIYEFHYRWLAEQPEFIDSKMEYVKTGHTTLKGPERQFANITWEEFIWADTLYMRGKTDEMLAIIYRPMQKGEKIPFDEKKINEYLKDIKKITQETKLAMYMNYDAMRKGALENRYRNLFPKRMSKKEFETLPEEERKRRMEKHKNSDFSWLDVHNTIMGENYYMADKYLKTRLSTVLAHIDKTIAEQKENKK